jgi:hypothetical protein
MTVLQPHQAIHKLPTRSSISFRFITAVPWLGLILIVVLSSLTTDRIGPAPTQRNWVFGRLDHMRTFGQTFVAQPGTLIALRVLLLANPSDRDDRVTLRLRYVDRDLPDLAVSSLPLRELSQRDWATFKLQPLTLNLTSSLRLDVEAPTLSQNDWITVIAGPDTYPDGEMLVDNLHRQSADLAFQPVYQRRWIDGLLPISRMAQGKPGVLGWPPLYALLGYACCVMLARLISWLWRSGDSIVDAQ